MHEAEPHAAKPHAAKPHAAKPHAAKARIIQVRQGEVRPTGSWLYVWVDAADGSVAYVGGTGFDPELRAYLHLRSEDPEVGRVRATVPGFDERDFDVLAFRIPDDVSRPAAKHALAARLVMPGRPQDAAASSVDAMPTVVDPIVECVEAYLRNCEGP
ncbi:hypothetical protein [Microbacterium candidum]|uniref:GIY-YIG nuclease family protein n=1 Tax=Microbacterium candidum TaxID=3041922 RepID=A0ABT7N0D7_9MICO|nr:hypothetical protein [Microbacterium sp. ASV49]MDL9980170.1 hypothetical protein [Microbacterium sp. ASV49]